MGEACAEVISTEGRKVGGKTSEGAERESTGYKRLGILSAGANDVVR